VLCASRGEADVSCREQNVKRDAEKVEFALNCISEFALYLRCTQLQLQHLKFEQESEATASPASPQTGAVASSPARPTPPTSSKMARSRGPVGPATGGRLDGGRGTIGAAPRGTAPPRAPAATRAPGRGAGAGVCSATQRMRATAKEWYKRALAQFLAVCTLLQVVIFDAVESNDDDALLGGLHVEAGAQVLLDELPLVARLGAGEGLAVQARPEDQLLHARSHGVERHRRRRGASLRRRRGASRRRLARHRT
jgi:hypothetical protein